MRIVAVIIALSLGLLSSAGRADPVERPDYADDLWAMTPLEFLSYLKSTAGSQPSFYTITEPLKGWVRKEHIPALMALLDSEEPCTAVVDAHSSFLPHSSTVGREAAMMIVGFRDGIYPSLLYAEHYGANSKEELRAWWDSQSLR